jgi:hypothetical protein
LKNVYFECWILTQRFDCYSCIIWFMNFKSYQGILLGVGAFIDVFSKYFKKNCSFWFVYIIIVIISINNSFFVLTLFSQNFPSCCCCCCCCYYYKYYFYLYFYRQTQNIFECILKILFETYKFFFKIKYFLQQNFVFKNFEPLSLSKYIQILFQIYQMLLFNFKNLKNNSFFTQL